MRSYFSCFLVFTLALYLTCGQKEAPLWPEHFSLAFHISGDAGKLNTTAKLWYDYKQELFRTQYDNGEDTECFHEFGRKTKCVELFRNNNIYLINPEESVCCHYQQQRAPKRDFLRTSNFTYVGESHIQSESFDLWQSAHNHQNKYYATKDAKQVPRRLALGTLIRDYIVTSFNDGEISPSVFAVPSYCRRACNNGSSLTRNSNKSLSSE